MLPDLRCQRGHVATQRIPEKDWKRIRKVQQEKLAMVCRSILDVIGRLVAQSQGAEHEPYLKIWDTIREEDKKIGLMFDGMSRGSAIFKLMEWNRNGLLSDEEKSLFSPETQEILHRIEEIQR